ncbi:MAG: DUF1360 domain-containing protein, partial [Patescibacteria group bacterium]|nr:DUF1360 domain-containing protein [Patescibacteria group bacterium]
WNFIFSILFIVVLVVAVVEMKQIRGGFLVSVPPFDAITMVFATFRITRLVVYDKIARWFRELFAQRRVHEEGGRKMVEVTPFGSGFRHTIYDLLHCPWCIGIWAALIVVFCYFVFPWAWSVIFFLALAGAGSFIQVVSNGIGWRAESLKLEAEEHQRNLQL